MFTDHHIGCLYAKYLESKFVAEVSLSYVRVNIYRALHFSLTLSTYSNSHSFAARTRASAHTHTQIYIIYIYGMDILIPKQFHIALLMLKTINNIFSILLVILTQVRIKFTVPCINFLYAQYTGTFTEPYIGYLHSKCMQKFIQPNTGYL
jgi:hypothetical protein